MRKFKKLIATMIAIATISVCTTLNVSAYDPVFYFNNGYGYDEQLYNWVQTHCIRTPEVQNSYGKGWDQLYGAGANGATRVNYPYGANITITINYWKYGQKCTLVASSNSTWEAEADAFRGGKSSHISGLAHHGGYNLNIDHVPTY